MKFVHFSGVSSSAKIASTARGDARTAIDAFVGVNIQHFRRLKLRFVLSRMNAVHGAHIDTRGVLRAHTWFADDVRHAFVLL
jgi:hypothetical protein